MLLSPKSISAARRAQSQQVGHGNPLSDFIDALTVDPGPGGGGSPAGFAVIFRPGALTAAPYYATWPEIQTIIASTQGDIVVFIDDTFVAPLPVIIPTASGVTQTFGRVVISPAAYAFAGPLKELRIEDGAALDNVRAFVGPMKITSPRTGAVPPLQHSAVNVTQLRDGAQLVLEAAATKPFIEVAPGQIFALAMINGAGVDNSLAPAVPVVDLLVGGAPAIHAWFTLDGFQWQGVAPVRGGVNAVFQYTHDLSSGGVDVSGIVGGSTARTLIDASADITFKPGAPATSLGATEFAVWSDILLNLPSGGAGYRALAPKTLYFDSSFAPGGVCIVPAPAVPGVLFFEGPVTWKGTNTAVGTNVILDATLVPLSETTLGDSFTFEDLNIEVRNTAAPVITIAPAVDPTEVRLTNVKVTCVGGQPLVRAAGLPLSRATAHIIMRGRSILNSGFCASVTGDFSRLDIEAYDRSLIDADTLDYQVNTVGDIRLDGAATLNYTQAGAPAFAPNDPPLLPSTPTLAVEGTFRQAFVDGGFPGTLNVIHLLSEKFVTVEIFDDTDAVVIPGVPAIPVVTSIVAIDENMVDIVFAAPIVGTWHVVVRR